MSNGVVRRIPLELWREIEMEIKEHDNMINAKIAQQRLARLIAETKKTFVVPKFTVKFDLTKCKIKKRMIKV